MVNSSQAAVGTNATTIANSFETLTVTATDASATAFTQLNMDASQITNGALNVAVTAGAGADTIIGGAGADTITGGAGADTITTGTGSDTVVLAANTAATTDTITDFSIAGGDVLSLSVTQNTAVAAINRIANGNDGAVAAGAAVVQHVGVAAAALGATTNVIVVDGAYANIAAVLTNIGTANVVSSAAANPTDNNDYVIVWSDGTNSHVNIINDADSGNNAAMLTADLTNDGEVATLNGINAATLATFASANFSFIA
jgi:hypothetical protein